MTDKNFEVEVERINGEIKLIHELSNNINLSFKQSSRKRINSLIDNVDGVLKKVADIFNLHVPEEAEEFDKRVPEVFPQVPRAVHVAFFRKLRGNHFGRDVALAFSDHIAHARARGAGLPALLVGQFELHLKAIGVFVVAPHRRRNLVIANLHVVVHNALNHRGKRKKGLHLIVVHNAPHKTRLVRLIQHHRIVPPTNSKYYVPTPNAKPGRETSVKCNAKRGRNRRANRNAKRGRNKRAKREAKCNVG